MRRVDGRATIVEQLGRWRGWSATSPSTLNLTSFFMLFCGKEILIFLRYGYFSPFSFCLVRLSLLSILKMTLSLTLLLFHALYTDRIKSTNTPFSSLLVLSVIMSFAFPKLYNFPPFFTYVYLSSRHVPFLRVHLTHFSFPPPLSLTLSFFSLHISDTVSNPLRTLDRSSFKHGSTLCWPTRSTERAVLFV